jgi:5'-nucleotidase
MSLKNLPAHIATLIFNCGLLLFFSLAFSEAATLPDSSCFPAKKLTIIGTGDLQGHLEPSSRSVHLGLSSPKTEVTGGISRIGTLIEQVRQDTTNPVIILSSGDDLMGRYFRQFSGKAIYELMDMAGYEILAPGNHDFDGGPGVLAEALESVSISALCSDLQVAGTVMENSCRQYLVKEYQGIRIGFFSLMTGHFPLITSAGNVRLHPDRKQLVREMVGILRKKGARVIIAITHIGSGEDVRLARQTAGIDIIFGGHSHSYGTRLIKINNTLIVNGGEKGSALVRLDINLDSSGHILADSAEYTLLPVSAALTPDRTISKKLKYYRDKLPTTAVIGKTLKKWNLTKTGLRDGESPVADLITDTIRHRFNTDIVLFNSGAFRGNTSYPAGPVTDTMISEIDEFENDIILLAIKGKYLRQILETSADRIGTGGFLQVSGLRFSITLSPSLPPGTGKIGDLEIISKNGLPRPIEPEQDYLVATNDFLALHGGDGYFQFKQFGHSIRNTYSTMGSILTDRFIKEHTVSPEEVDGRITIIHSQADSRK